MNTRVFRRLLAATALCALGLTLTSPRASAQQLQPTISTGLITSTASSGSSSYLAINGQSTCSILAYTSTGTASITVYGAADGFALGNSTYLVNPNFGTAGVVNVTSTPAVTAGNISTFPKGFYFSWSGNTGTITAIGTCSIATGVGGGGTAGSVTQGAGSSATPWYTRLCDATTTTNCVTVNASGQLAISNFPATQPVSGNVGITGTLPAYASAPTVIPQAATYTLLTALGNTVVKASPGTIYGIYNLSPNTQTVGVTCYDNASTNSGNLFANFVSPALLGPGQYVTFNPGGGSGIAATLGITCNLTGALTATTAIGVLWK